MIPRRDIPVSVTDHAKERMRERWPGVKPARIVDEVRLAIADGRHSPHRPAWLAGNAHSTTSYCWTADRCRVYALRVLASDAADKWVVMTVYVAEAAAA